MNPLRSVGSEPPPVWLLLGLLAVVLLGLWFERRRRRQGPGEDGGGGYHPADLRDRASVAPRPDDPEDVWLLGLAAPRVEAAGFLHETWELAPVPLDDRWRRHLARWAESYGVTSADQWREQVDRTDTMLAAATAPEPGEADQRPYLLATHAMLHRLGTALGHVDAATSKDLVRAHTRALRIDYVDWFGYGEAYVAWSQVAAPLDAPSIRAQVRLLYAPGGPWAEVAWPRRT